MAHFGRTLASAEGGDVRWLQAELAEQGWRGGRQSGGGGARMERGVRGAGRRARTARGVGSEGGCAGRQGAPG